MRLSVSHKTGAERNGAPPFDGRERQAENHRQRGSPLGQADLPPGLMALTTRSRRTSLKTLRGPLGHPFRATVCRSGRNDIRPARGSRRYGGTAATRSVRYNRSSRSARTAVWRRGLPAEPPGTLRKAHVPCRSGRERRRLLRRAVPTAEGFRSKGFPMVEAVRGWRVATELLSLRRDCCHPSRTGH